MISGLYGINEDHKRNIAMLIRNQFRSIGYLVVPMDNRLFKIKYDILISDVINYYLSSNNIEYPCSAEEAYIVYDEVMR